MARTGKSSAGLCVIMLVIGIKAQDMDNVLDINCDLKLLVAGSSPTIQEICGDNFQVIVHGLTYNEYIFPTESFPWKLEMTLVTDATDQESIIKSSKIVQIEQTELQGDNITGIITNYLTETLDDPEFHIPAGKCDNRDGKGIMRLYSEQPGFDAEYVTKGFFRVMCDFSDMDLKLQLQTTDGLPYPADVTSALYMDTSNTTSDLVFATELANLKIVVDGSIPPLEPADTCIFAIAFLTKAGGGHTIPTNQYCTETGAETKLPEISYYDVLLGVPICLSTVNDGGDLLQMIRDSNQNISVCGQYTLVIQVDPFHTLYNEMNKCNNFITFEIYINCPMSNTGMAPASCEVVMDPFGGPQHELFETRFIYHKVNYSSTTFETFHNVRMFRQEKQHWMEVHDNNMDVHDDRESKGFGLLKILNMYIEDKDIESTCSDLVSDGDIQNAISQLEGLNDDLLKASQDMNAFVPAFITAKGMIDQLRTSMDYNGIALEVERIIISRVDADINSPFNERVKSMAAVNAMNATLSLASALQSSASEIEIGMYAQMEACKTAAWLEYVLMIMMSLNDYSNPVNQKNGEEMFMNLVGNLTKTVLFMHHLYSDFTCIEDVLINMLNYAEEWTLGSPEERANIDLDWMFDVDQVRDTNEVGNTKVAFSGCKLKLNQCVKKLQTMCISSHISSVMSSADSRHEICKARYLKQQAEKQFKWLGMRFRRGMDNDECRKDPLAPHKGPLTLWKMKHERVGHGYGQVIYRGIPTIDNKNIMWQKASVCTCENCYENAKKRK